jgi:acid stress-induced BolA-like protein IbaG/YrbA
MDSNSIEQMIKDGIPDATVVVQSEDGVHFEASVSSRSFAGKSPLQRHRLVYATLGTLVGNEIHALSLQTSVPE